MASDKNKKIVHEKFTDCLSAVQRDSVNPLGLWQRAKPVHYGVFQAPKTSVPASTNSVTIPVDKVSAIK
jgi:hypothetical protein